MTLSEARDAILNRLVLGWPSEYPLRFPDVPSNTPNTNEGIDGPWARAGVTHGPQGQGSLAGADGVRRWTRTGFVWVQIFTPVGDGGTKRDELGQLVLEIYQDKQSDGVWYRNARFNEITNPNNGAFSQGNVLCDFSYDDVR